MSTPSQEDWYWCRHTNGDGTWSTRVGRRTPEGPPGADLAALRRGLGREPWSVPAMWPFYVQTGPPQEATKKYTAEQAAEHAALTLFAVHQQAQERPMHRAGVGLGTAAFMLRQHAESARSGDERAKGKQANGTAAESKQVNGSTAEPKQVDWSRIDPVDRRFAAAATATDLTELVLHLRGLVTQLRGIGQPLDYTKLYEDLCRWQDPGRADEVRRWWGMQYFTRVKETPTTTETEETP